MTSGEHRGDFYITYEIRLKNNGEETVSGLTVYDIPQYLDTNTGKSRYGFYDEGQLKIFSLLYPNTISGGGYMMTRGSGSQFSTDPDKQGYFSVPNVSVAPGQEIVWQYTVYLPKEDPRRTPKALTPMNAGQTGRTMPASETTQTRAKRSQRMLATRRTPLR